jgi:hypothetical protein
LMAKIVTKLLLPFPVVPRAANISYERLHQLSRVF